MRRPLLLTIAALGSLICLVGGTGLFAALTDSARTGTNQVDSAQLAASADIQIATATQSGNASQCGTFSEDLATGFFTVANVEVGYQSPLAFFCIKNVGSQPVTLWASVDELVDTDTACTGDEALHGDATCGGNQLGELSSVISVSYVRQNSCSAFDGSGFGRTLKENATNPEAFPGTLAAGATACFYTNLEYKTNASAADVQKAQSDRVTWRFKFRADA